MPRRATGLAVYHTHMTVGREQFNLAFAATSASYLALQQQIGAAVIQHRRPPDPRRWRDRLLLR